MDIFPIRIKFYKYFFPHKYCVRMEWERELYKSFLQADQKYHTDSTGMKGLGSPRKTSLSNIKPLNHISLLLAKCLRVGRFLGGTLPGSTWHLSIASVPDFKASPSFHTQSLHQPYFMATAIAQKLRKLPQAMNRMSDRPGVASRTLSCVGWYIAFHCFTRLQAGLLLPMMLN